MWRLMESSDLDAVNHIADIVWGDQYYESPEVFRQKFKYYPRGCWMYNSDAYIFSHPAVLNSPPDLNETLVKIIPDCYHIHDIALLPRVRGLRIADRMIRQLIKTNQYPHMSLVAVAGTEEFWEPYGFTQIIDTAYGQYMIR